MQVKVLQLNVWYGRTPDFNDLTSFLKKEDADIMFFQEVYDGKDTSLPQNYRLFEIFKKEFPEHHAVFKAAFADITPVGNIESGNAIFVRGKIKEHKNIFFDAPYKTFDNEAQTDFSNNPQTVVFAKAEIESEALNLFSLHGIWGFDGRDNARRFQMVDKVISEFQGKENVILAGDFNLNPDTTAAKRIGKHLKSVFGLSLKSTFNVKLRNKPWAKTAVVDMIFVSPNINVIEKDCPVVDASDHLPLIATLEIQSADKADGNADFREN